MWNTYQGMLNRGDMSEGDILDALGLGRYCCRRMVLTHADLIERLLTYNIYEPNVHRGPPG